MDVYKKDSDSFSPEYLAYLGTLIYEVFESKCRITKDSTGKPVRVEVWLGENKGYLDFPLPGWMKPGQSATQTPQ